MGEEYPGTRGSVDLLIMTSWVGQKIFGFSVNLLQLKNSGFRFKNSVFYQVKRVSRQSKMSLGKKFLSGKTKIR